MNNGRITRGIIFCLTVSFNQTLYAIDAPFGNNSSGILGRNDQGASQQTYGIETANPPSPPVPVKIMNYPDIGTSISDAILAGYTYESTSLVTQLYPILSNAIAYGISRQVAEQANPLNEALAIASQTGTNLQSDYSYNQAVTFNLNDTTSYVYQGLLYPLTSSINAELSNNTSLDTVFANMDNYAMSVPALNYSNIKDNDNNTSNNGTTYTQATMNINELISTSDGSNLTDKRGFLAWEVLIRLMSLQLDSCNTSLTIQNDSSSSSSSSSSSMDTTTSTYGLIPAKTNQTCSNQAAQCMITYTVQQIIPSLLTAMKSTDSYTRSNLMTSNPVEYNTLVGILTSDSMSSLQSSYNKNINFSECLNADASSYNTRSDSIVMTDLDTVGTMLSQTLAPISQYNRQNIATAIMSYLSSHSSSSSSTSSDDIPMMYTLTDAFNLNTLTNNASLIGSPSSASICTLKLEPNEQTLDDKRQAINASTLLSYLSNFGSIPSAISPEITIDASIAAIGGGFGSLNNTNNFNSADATTITSNRSTSKMKVDKTVSTYNDTFSTYIAPLSTSLDVLADSQNRRQNQVIIPALYDTNGTQINSASSDPYTTGYIPAGESCTTAEIDQFTAQYRLTPIDDSSTVETSPWLKSIQTQNNSGLLLKQQNQLLAEMRGQLYQEQEQLETQLIMQAISLLAQISGSTSVLTTLKTDIDDAITKFNNGGGKINASTYTSSSSTSTTSSS